jgi:phasin
MSRNVLDLTPAELDKLARDAWSDAARQALERGLPVSGSRDGRRFRYHPDGRIEDLGPTDGVPATESTPTLARSNVETPTLHFQGKELPEAYREMAEVRLSQASDAYHRAIAEVHAATILAVKIGVGSKTHDAANPTDPFSASVLPFEVPEQTRVFAEKGVSQARDSYAKFKDAAETHNGTIEAAFTSASKDYSEYSAKLMEMMKANNTASLEFAQELLGVKSPSEAIELWTSHAKKQYEALVAQAKELAELSQKVVTKTVVPMQAKANDKDSSVA